MNQGLGEPLVNSMQHLNEQSWSESTLPLDRLLTEGEATGCIVTLSSSDRPPRGWAGMMDWRTQGALSHSLRSGIFTGQAGECGYFPWNFHGSIRHILLLGIGPSESLSTRATPPSSSLAILEKNLKKLPGIRWALSRSEFSEKTWSAISRAIPEGGGLWITT